MQIRKYIGPIAVIGLILIATVVQLRLQGRLWVCTCPRIFATGDAWGSQTSQLFLDPYSLTHLAHGLMFAGLLGLVFRRTPPSWRLVIAVGLESAWEIIENTNTVIDRYRAATASLDYHGDTIVNSLGDITACAIGFMLARKLGWVRSIILFLAVEIVLVLWIRDSLILEIIMLIHPIQAIKVWQLGH